MAFKETIELNSSPEDAQRKKEENFWNHYDTLFDSTHYTILKDVGGMEYDNKFSLDFQGMITALTLNSANESKIKRYTIDDFANVLKSASIKKAAEVGAGIPYTSMIQNLIPAFKKAGTELFSIGDSSSIYNAEFEKDGVRVIPEEAGELPAEKLNLDLVIAHDVFSLGGQHTAGREYKQF